MKKITLITMLMASTSMMAQTATVSSPDGRLKLDFNLNEGKPTYNVTYDKQQVLDESPLGFVASIGDFSQNLEFEGETKEHLTYDYDLNRCKVSKVHVDANQLVVTLHNGKKQSYQIDFRVSNNDIAFRYTIPNLPDREYGKKFSIRIMDEKTGFDFPTQTTTFLTPQSKSMVGWKGTKPSYEEVYEYDQPMTKRSAAGNGYTFPCLFKVPVAGAKKQKAQDYWVLVSETGTDSRYCGCRISDMKGDGLYEVEFAMPEENNGNGTIEPAFALPGSTPWRTITIGNSLKPIVETTIPWDYVTPRYETANNYKFGKSGWSWIIWQDGATNYDDQVKFIDMASSLGWPYILIDAFWDKNIGYNRMEDLVKYARSKGVEIFLWYSSSGYWNDIESGPINVMSDAIARKRDMRWMNKIGVKGIKVDFFGGDKQETMRIYEQILSDADDNGIMVIFHGCTLPRGWERMYPNFVGSEAVLASENIYFGQWAADKEAKDTATHPFIRNAVASMEFGGSFLSRTLNRGNDPDRRGTKRKTTDAHELAQAVLFQNPIQNFAVTPENLGEQQKNDKGVQKGGVPSICLDFMKKVPTVWDETIFIDGYPGKYCVLARRCGSKWYIAGNNATGAPLTLKLSLPMLSKGDELTLYSDNLTDLEPQRSSLKYNGKVATVSMADQGGFVIIK